MDDAGYAIVAKEVALLGPSPARDRVEKIFGKFQFRLCHVCYLKSLGVKPLKEVSVKSDKKDTPHKPSFVSK